MVRFICFGSGSSGNCYYLMADGYGIVIDLGISVRNLRKHFRDYGLSLSQVKALLVTHDHTDHVKAVGAFSQEFHIPVYTSEEIHKGMERNYFMQKKVAPEMKHLLTNETPIQMGPFEVVPFAVPHDSAGNNGYFIRYADVRFCLITDAGSITEQMLNYIRQANYLVIEANYDEAMLATGPYPEFLKRRITSGKGHTGNADTAKVLAEHLHPEAKRVWLCHLSEENNHPELARKTVECALRAAAYPLGSTLQLDVLKRKVPSLLHELV